MKRLLPALLLATSCAAHAAAPSPKLVVVLVVDGLPQEQVMRYRDQFGQGGFRRLLEQGASFANAHQAHGITVTAVGHSAVLTGAYPYQHGIVGNNWIDPATHTSVYCTEDHNYHYIGAATKPEDGTSPARLRVSTVGDELRYATGERAKVVTVSGKDRGAILLAGHGGTAYMYMDSTGGFASSTYYMQQHPAWVEQYNANKPADRYYGKSWKPLLADAAYAGDAEPHPFALSYYSDSGANDSNFYSRLRTGPVLDELTLDFARAAVESEQLGRNPAGVPDLLGVSLSAHDYINHAYGPESAYSHDHLQRLDRMLAGFFGFLDQRLGQDAYLVVLTADHGFPNRPEFAQGEHRDAGRLDAKQVMADLDKQLAARFGVEKLVQAYSMPNIYLDLERAEKAGAKREDVEAAAARFLTSVPGIVQVYTRAQMEAGGVADTRMGLLMRRAWNREVSGDLMAVTKPNWYFGSGTGTSHGSPYSYDTNVPLLMMGKPWIKPGAYPGYAEVVDIAPTLAWLLHIRPPSAAEGRVLAELLR